MGAAQSAQWDDGQNEEDERNKVEDDAEDKKPLQNKDQISKINGKTDDAALAEVIDHCEHDAVPDDAAETEKPELQSVKTNPDMSPEAKETGPPEMTNMEIMQKDINQNFRRFFESISLKVTPKKNSGENDENAKDVPDETNTQDSPSPDVEDHISKSENGELNADQNAAQETVDNDSAIFITPTDLTFNDNRDNMKEMCVKMKESDVETPPDHTDAEMSSPVSEQENKNHEATPEEETSHSSPCSPDEVIISPIKRFFTTGIFSGLRKKKKPPDDETHDKEQLDTGRKTSAETTEQLVEKEKEVGLGVKTGAKESKPEEIFEASPAEISDGSKDREKTSEGKSPTTDPSTLTVDEPENLNLPDKVQASPIKRLLSGSSFKKLTKKQRSRRASDSKLSESGRRVSDQLTSSSEASESPAHLTEGSGQEDGTWASFKKLVTPKKHMKRLSLPNEATQESRPSGSVEEPKTHERDQISDLSGEERKKSKDSSVSWEAVLCGSGRRRSRKTSDSDDEILQHEKGNMTDSESKPGAESPGSSKEPEELLTTSPQQTESPSDGDGESTWRSLKRLVTPQKKSKDEENAQSSDSEVTQDEHSFSIKKLLPGRIKRKSVEKQDRATLDDFGKELASDDEESETPAVVPLSEFDTIEIEVHTQAQADPGSQMTKAGDEEPQKDLLDEPNQPVVSSHHPITETEKGKDETLENLSAATPGSNEESESAELLSKHQQLSDIPEETMTTAASVTEEVVRDDTIAEDVIEITSEAITAPEPLDSTQADETEMISAVSQLTDSSKTSGNATPVPVDCGIKETEVLLHQVVEAISMTPKDVPVCVKDVSLDSEMGSTDLQIQEMCLKEEPSILAKHNLLCSTSVNTDLFKLDRKDHFSVTPQTETESEVSNTISIESVSDPTEEFVSVKCPGEEVYKVSISQPEENNKESPDESQPLEEYFYAENESGTTGCCVIGVHQDEVKPEKVDSQHKDSAAAETDEKKKPKEEVQTLLEQKCVIIQNASEQVQHEDQCPLLVVVPEWQKFETVPEDKTASETSTDEPKNIATPFMKFNVGQENNSELQADDSNAKHVQVLEELQGTLHIKEGRVQSLNTEEKSGNLLTLEIVKDEPENVIEQLTEVNVQSDYELQTDADKPKDVQVLEVLESVQAEESKKITTPLAELHFNDEAAESEHVNVLKVIQGTELDSEVGRDQKLVMEAAPEDTLASKTVQDEYEDTLQGHNEINVVELQMDAAQPEHIESTSKVLQHVQAGTIDTEKEIISNDIPISEKRTGEITKTTVPITKGNVESENKVKQVETDKPENSQESQVLETIPTGTLESEDDRIQLVIKEVTTEKHIKHKPNQEIKDLTEVDSEQEDELKMEAAQLENVQVPQILQAVQMAMVDSETDAVQFQEKEVKSDVSHAQPENVQVPEVLEAVLLAMVESETGDVQLQEKEAKPDDSHPQPKNVPVQVAMVESETGGVQFQENEVKSDPSQAPPENIEVPEVLEAIQLAKVDSGTGGVQFQEKEVKLDASHPQPENVPVQLDMVDSETGSIEFQENEVKSDVSHSHPENVSVQMAIVESGTGGVQFQEKEVKADVSQAPPENIQVPEVLEGVQLAKVDSGIGGIQFQEKEVKSDGSHPHHENVTVQLDMVNSETGGVQFQENQVKSDASHPQPENSEPTAAEPKKLIVKTEMQELENLEQGQAQDILEITSQSGEGVDLECEVPSQEILTVKIVTDKPKQVEVSLEDTPESQKFIDESKSTTEPPTKNKDLQVEAAEHVHAQVSEVMEILEVVTLDLQDKNVQSPKKDVPAAEAFLAGPKQLSSPKDKNTELKTDQVQDLDQLAYDAEDVSDTDKTELEVVAQQGQLLNIQNSITNSLQKLNISENIHELQTSTDIYIPSVDEKTSSVQDKEKTVTYEEMPASCACDTLSEVAYEIKDEAHLSEVQVSDEGENKDKLVETTTVELITSDLKESVTTTPDAQEPSIDTRVPTFNETTEVVTALMKSDPSEMEDGECVGTMMCEDSRQSVDCLENQAQLDHGDTKSEQTNADTVFEVEITEVTKATDDRHKTENTKEGITKEILENFPEGSPECTIVQSVHTQKEVLNLTNVQTEVTEQILHELSQENQKTMQDSCEIIPDPQAEKSEMTKAEISLQHAASQDLNNTRDIQGNLNAFICDHIKSSVTVKAATCSESSSANIVEAQSPQKDQNHVGEPSHSVSVVPQNSALVSSTDNEMSRSSLSLELIPDTQFGHLKAAVKQTDKCQVIVQTVQGMMQTNAPAEAESKKPTEITGVAVQETETPEAATTLDSRELTAIKNQLLVKDATIQMKELVQEVQQTKSVETEIPVQPEPTKIETVPSKTHVQETEAAESDTQKACEEDVWLDAEEVTGMCLLVQHDTQVYRAEMAIVEPEFETTPECHTAEATEPQIDKRGGGRGECESEGEDFSAACEHPETTTESNTTAECD